jgi:hypothetical protein
MQDMQEPQEPQGSQEPYEPQDSHHIDNVLETRTKKTNTKAIEDEDSQQQVTGGVPSLSLETTEGIVSGQSIDKRRQKEKEQRRKRERKKREKKERDLQRVMELNKCTCPTKEKSVSNKVKKAFEEIVQTVLLSLEGLSMHQGMRETFETFDVDGNKSLSLNEFIELLELLEIGVEEPFSLQEKRSLFDLFDRNRDGEICFSDFERALYPSVNEHLSIEK